MTGAAPEPKPYPQPLSDHAHLRLLSVLHAVHGVLALLIGAGYGALLLFMVSTDRFKPPAAAPGRPAQPGTSPPLAPMIETMFAAMAIVYVAGGITFFVLGLLLARWLTDRRRRILCLVAAGLLCFLAPFGTILGVFTIVVLCRRPVAEEFARNERPAVPTAR